LDAPYRYASPQLADVYFIDKTEFFSMGVYEEQSGVSMGFLIVVELVQKDGIIDAFMHLRGRRKTQRKLLEMYHHDQDNRHRAL
jgi:hypothetical protein